MYVEIEDIPKAETTLEAPQAVPDIPQSFVVTVTDEDMLEKDVMESTTKERRQMRLSLGKHKRHPEQRNPLILVQMKKSSKYSKA
ncbi:hypothetical protein LIER_08916 [Lithospermum erythrorhizon]|uniref:Uncharacterized protein n=1 Tax=Lithospermum erythrorhizon TaxID=34254 RepID=A0AAV3PFY1_LITER